MSSSARASAPENGSTARPSSRAADSVAREVAPHRNDSPRPARAGSRYATVDPVPSPTRMPSSTSATAASAARCFSRSLATDEILQVEVEERADRVDRDVRLRMRGEEIRIVRELPLQREHRGHAVAPVPLGRSEDPDLVVDEHVPIRREAALDVLELLLLVNVHEDPVHDGPDTGAGDLARLEDRVAVGEHHRRCGLAEPGQGLERLRIETVRERIVEQILGGGEESLLPALRLPPLLDCAQIVAVAELHEAALLDRPVGGPR